MRIDHPGISQIPALQALWKEAFGDEDSFIDRFFSTAYDPKRCMCIGENHAVVAAAYWFDVTFSGQKAAYIYAVATKQSHRGHGLCRQLMDNIHTHLAERGYAGTMLVPGDMPLRQMYGGMGYVSFGGMEQISVIADGYAQVQPISPEEFAALRRQWLPSGGVVQEGENLDFLQQHFRFYHGQNCLFAASLTDGKLYVPEFWGDRRLCSGITAALGATKGSFRMAGNQSFAMYRPLIPGESPTYFGFAFD